MTRDELMVLRKIAEAAAPGPWVASGCCVETAADPWGPDGMIIYDEGGHNTDDAAHIAAFNPQTAIRLIDELLARENP